jgi:acyl carrier protein
MTSTNELLMTKVNAAFRTAFELDSSADLTGLEYNVSKEWDSVAHMALVAALEQEFDCMLEMDEIIDMSSYTKVLEIMQKYA